MPRFQNQGIGGALIEEGLAGAKRAGVDFVLVLGEPRYYERFGFRASLAAAVEVAWAGPHLMGLQVTEKSPPQGRAQYPRAFGP